MDVQQIADISVGRFLIPVHSHLSK